MTKAKIKITGLNFIRTYTETTNVITAHEREAINNAARNSLAKIERMTYCALAGISEEEYELRQAMPKLFEPEQPKEIIDLEFKD